MNNQRAQRDCIDGLLLLDKPKGMTSNDALMRARRLFNARKAGHGGTLDPMASGLLPIAFGEATKFAGDALGADKTYVAEITFGVTTDTADAEGRELQRRPVAVDEQRLRDAVAGFVGNIDQVPPMYSALKRAGKPLYEYARAGETVERVARSITIHAIDLLEVSAVEGVSAGEPGSLRAVLRVACSKGTYVRTLAEDIGEQLGCGAHLSGLRRERVGAVDLDRAVTLDQIEAMDASARAALLQPLDFLLADLPRVELDDAFARRFLHGQRLRLSAPASPALPTGHDISSGAAARERPEGDAVSPGDDSARVRVYGRNALLGVGTLDDGLLVPLRLVGTAAEPARPSAEHSNNTPRTAPIRTRS